MQLSTIKSNITSGLSEVKNRVQTNWTNMSTTAKVATVAVSAILAAGAVAAAVFGHLGLAALAVSATVSAAIVHGTTAGLGALGLVVPSFAMLRNQKAEAPKAEQKPVEIAPVVVAQEPVIETAPVVEAPVVKAPVVAPSRLSRAKNASVAFVKAHPRMILGAGAAIALAAGIKHSEFTMSDVQVIRKLAGHTFMSGLNLINNLENSKNGLVSLNF